MNVTPYEEQMLITSNKKNNSCLSGTKDWVCLLPFYFLFLFSPLPFSSPFLCVKHLNVLLNNCFRKAPETSERVPFSLAVVLDRSGSMSGMFIFYHFHPFFISVFLSTSILLN